MSNSCYLDNINCVRWNPSGDMLASASCDTTIALLDFKTGKTLYTGSNWWGGNLAISSIKTIPNELLDFATSVCFI